MGPTRGSEPQREQALVIPFDPVFRRRGAGPKANVTLLAGDPRKGLQIVVPHSLRKSIVTVERSMGAEAARQQAGQRHHQRHYVERSRDGARHRPGRVFAPIAPSGRKEQQAG